LGPAKEKSCVCDHPLPGCQKNTDIPADKENSAEKPQEGYYYVDAERFNREGEK
jgi:hypothetical protein